MITIPKIVGVSSCALVLCIGLSHAHAAHPQAETSPSDDRGSQGNQDLIKGDSTPRKGDEKADETNVKEDTKKAKQEFDKRNAKGHEQLGDRSRVPLRSLQTN
ncbi:MAG: hypothetical protein ABIO96_13720 [Nitrospiraceae bacterium]